MFDVQISEQADNDLRGIFEYIAFELLAPENAAGQLNRLEEAISKLDHMPENFYNLPSQENVLQALQQLHKVYSPYLDVFILSCYLPDSAFAFSEKRRWCLEHIPEIPERNHLFVPFGMKKEDYVPGRVHTDDVLLDDYTSNLLEWTGRGVKCLNGINHTRRTWKGSLIDYEMLTKRAAEWRKKNPREAYKNAYRAIRIANKKNGVLAPSQVKIDPRPLKVRLRHKYRLNEIKREYVTDIMKMKFGVRESTCIGYRDLYDRYIKTEYGNRGIEKFKKSDIKNMYVKLKASKELSGGTASSINTGIRLSRLCLVQAQGSERLLACTGKTWISGIA